MKETGVWTISFHCLAQGKIGRKEVAMRNLHLGPKLFHPINYKRIMEGKQQRVRRAMCF